MPDHPSESFSRHSLILENPKGFETMELARRLREVGAPMSVVADFDEAAEVLREGELDVGAILVPTHHPPDFVRRQMNSLCNLAPKDGMRLVSVGDEPDKSTRKKLRKAGVKLAMWNPLIGTNLRFQLYRAHNPAPDGFGNRECPRVPTALSCSVRVADRSREVAVFRLAESGAFLATERAVMNGASLELDLHLPSGAIDALATVVYANVPGNLQRPGLPLGMGIQFEALARRDKKRLRHYIRACVNQLDV